MKQEEAVIKPAHEVYSNPDAFKLVFEGGNDVPVKMWHHQIGMLGSGVQILVRPVATTEELTGVDLIGKTLVRNDNTVNSVRLYGDGSFTVYYTWRDDEGTESFNCYEKLEVYL